MVEPFVSGPSYPKLDNTQLGTALGNLPGDFRKAQSDQLVLQQQQQEIERQKFLAEQQKAQQTAFAGGLPMANGQLDTASYMQTLAQKGLLPPDQAAKLAGLQLNQEQYQPAPADQFLGGGGAAPQAGAQQPAAGGDALGRLEAGIARVESGGEKDPYRAIGRETGSGDRAYGKYQVMGANIPKWTEEVLGRKMTRQEFLNDPQAQEAVSKAKLGQYLEKYGDAPDAASMWFTGKPLAQGGNKRDVNGMTGSRYAELATGTKNDATPSIPPVSAAAGSSIPRSNSGAQPAGGTGGIGLGARSATRSANGGAQPTLGAGQTVASLAQGLSPNQASNIAKAIGAPSVNAPLNQDQTQKLQRIIAGNYGGGQGQQPAQGGAQPAQAPQQGGQPLVYQPQLDPGFKTQQDEIAAETKYISELRRNPRDMYQKRADQLEKDRQERIKSISPITTHPGTQIVSPGGDTLFEAPTAGERTLAERKDEAHEIAQGIKSGTIPPTAATGSGVGPLVRAELAKGGDYNLTKANLEYEAAKKQIMSLNGPQMFRFNALAESVVNTIDRTVETSKELRLSGIPLANEVELGAWLQANGNSPKGQLVASYMTDVWTLKEEYANLANGGYAPTESAWKLSNMVVNGDYGSKQLEASLKEAQRLINFRRSAFSDLSTMGPGAPNPYMPGRGQGGAVQSPTEGGGRGQGGGGPMAPGTQLEGGFIYKGTR
jgi:hypothetical protein